MPSCRPSMYARGTAITRKCGANAAVTRPRSRKVIALEKTTSLSWRSWATTRSCRMAQRPTTSGIPISRSTMRSASGNCTQPLYMEVLVQRRLGACQTSRRAAGAAGLVRARVLLPDLDRGHADRAGHRSRRARLRGRLRLAAGAQPAGCSAAGADWRRAALGCGVAVRLARRGVRHALAQRARLLDRVPRPVARAGPGPPAGALRRGGARALLRGRAGEIGGAHV